MRALWRGPLVLGVLAVALAGCLPGGDPPESALLISVDLGGPECEGIGDIPYESYSSCVATGIVTVTNDGPDATFGPVVLKAIGGVAVTGDRTFARISDSTCGVQLDVGESCEATLTASSFFTEFNGVVGTVHALSAHATASEDFSSTTG